MPAARLAFNQSLALSALCSALFLAVALALRTSYATNQSADVDTARLAAQYLLWFIPAMALQFPLVSMSAALRGTGNFKVGVAVGIVTIVINMLVAPVLIFGWLGAPALGISGAAIASLMALVVGNVWLALYCRRGAVMRFARDEWRPRPAVWRRLLSIGLPAGFDFAMMAVYLFIVYSVTKPFGSAAQAGFGIGMRVMQAGFMPVVALGMSVAPIAGQNFGARHADRVKHTFRDGAVLASLMMGLFFALCHLAPSGLIRIFTRDPAAIAVGDEYLRIISWTFAAVGINFVAGSMFQAMGNTLPSVFTSLVRIVLVAVPVTMLAHSPSFRLATIWHLGVLSVWVQLALALLLLRREFDKRLSFDVPAGAPIGVPDRVVAAAAGRARSVRSQSP